MIANLDRPRLTAFDWVLFERAPRRAVALTMSNVEYSFRLANPPAEKLRHQDYCFEWTRAEFQSWGSVVGLALWLLCAVRGYWP